MTPPDPQLVLTQDAWLRRIARSLVRDPELADDLVQDAWLAGLERDRTDADSRPWLAGVLRNGGRAFFRRSDRRTAREERVARRDEAPSTDEVVEQLQLRERASRELLELEEPYRTALYLTFVQDVSMREAARRTGVAPSTVNERVHEGLARLRKRIDRAYDGDRRAWVSALVPLARPSGVAALLPGGLAMLAAASLIVVGGVAGGIALFGPDPSSVTESPVEPDTLVASARPAETSPELSGPVPVTGAREAIVSDTSAQPLSPPVGEAQDDEPQRGVSGEVLLADGSAAAGATWQVTRSADDVTDPTGTVGADGRLDARFDQPESYQFFFSVGAEGHVRERWTWAGIKDGEVKDVGTITLRRAGSVTGRIVGSDGRPLTGNAWAIHAIEVWDEDGLGRLPAYEVVHADEQDGRFRVDQLPPGPVTLKVYDSRFGWSSEHTVTVVEGEDLAKDIVLVESEAMDTRIVVGLSTPVFAMFAPPADENVWLVAANGERRNAYRDPIMSGTWTFDGVPPGEYSVEIDDPSYEPWSRSGVAPGDKITADLRGSASIDLDVRSEDGAPIREYEVDLKFANADLKTIRVRSGDGTAASPEGPIGGLIPADYRIAVRCDGRVGGARVDGLGAGETRAVEVVVLDASAVRGVVSRPDGTPAANVLVRLIAPAEVDDSPETRILHPRAFFSNPERMRHERGRATTNDDGTYELAMDVPGRYLVIAGDTEGPMEQSPIFDTAAAAPPQDLALTVARGGVLEGRIEFPSELEPQGCYVLFVGAGTSAARGPKADLDRDGRFVLGPLEPGAGDLYLLLSRRVIVEGGVPTNGLPLGGIQIVEGETITTSFDFPGGEPARLTLDVSASGLGSSTVRAFLTNGGNDSLADASSANGTVGPLTTLAGTYELWLGGDGWAARRTNVALAEGETRTDALDLGLTTKRIRFTRDGAPLAKKRVELDGKPNGFPLQFVKTDADGWVEIRLGAGEYSFSFIDFAPTLTRAQGTVTWPLADGVDAIELGE